MSTLSTGADTVQCVHHLFERQVRERPDARAIDFPAAGTWLSYAELNRRANQYAHSLRVRGIGPGALVGVFLQNTPERIALLIAVHKAGAGYGLLDPDHPREYLSSVLGGVAFSLLITEERFLDRLPAGEGPIISLNTLCEQLFCLDPPDPESELPTGPADVAYIAFTSGSTGRPKAAVIPHVASVNHVEAVREAYGLTDTDRIPLCASPGFDLTVEEIFSALSSGATIVLLPNGALSSEHMSSLIVEEHLTALNLPGSLWHRWVGALLETGAAIPEPLRVVVVGSEVIYTSRLAEWGSLRGAERVRWIAAYGLTETAVTATLYQHDPRLPLPPTPTVPIGSPIRNVEAVVLDEQLQVLPPGVPGNLYIGGLCLAREYLNEPELTAQKFKHIHLPGRCQASVRLYETGDRALRLENGTLVWLGRDDDQIKWHGFRIEPAEVEGALCQHPNVLEAVVVLQQTRPATEAVLVAYCVFASSESPSSPSLRAFLSRMLPTSRIPVCFYRCDSLPRTPSGKVNRRVLSHTTFAMASDIGVKQSRC